MTYTKSQLYDYYTTATPLYIPGYGITVISFIYEYPDGSIEIVTAEGDTIMA